MDAHGVGETELAAAVVSWHPWSGMILGCCGGRLNWQVQCLVACLTLRPETDQALAAFVDCVYADRQKAQSFHKLGRYGDHTLQEEVPVQGSHVQRSQPVCPDVLASVVTVVASDETVDLVSFYIPLPVVQRRQPWRLSQSH